MRDMRLSWAGVASALGWRFSSDDNPGPRPVTDQLIGRILSAAGQSGGPVTREEAERVPAILQARRDVVAIATLPLAAYRLSDWEQQDNSLLRQIDPDIPNVTTLAQTIDDLFYDSIAWWEVTARDFDNFPIAARHLALSSVVIKPHDGPRSLAPLPSGEDPRGGVPYVDGVKRSWRDLIRFDSPMPPVLRVAAGPVRRSIALDAAADLYASDPKPLDYLRAATDAEEGTDEEIEEALDDWRRYRRENATGYLPKWLEYVEVSAPTPQELQLVEQKREATLDIANAVGGDPEDFGVSTTSRTYANAVDRRQDKVNINLAPYMRAITDRLSMGDVTRRGYVVAFDLDDFLKPNATERWGINKTAVEMGAMGPKEVRKRERLGPPLPGDKPKPATPPPAPAAPADSIDGAESNTPAVVESAAARPTYTFAGGVVTLTLDDWAEFAVDAQSRTITGLLMPYGKLVTWRGLRLEFAPGSLQWDDPERVKFLRQHDPLTAMGYASKISANTRGVKISFKVGHGPLDDQTLVDAEDKVWDGLSAGVEFDLETDTVPHPRERGAYLVKRAHLREGSITPIPAFDDARVTSVMASHDPEGIPMEDCAACGTQHAPGAHVVPAPAAAPAVTPAADPMAAQFAAFTAWQNAQTPAAAPAAPAAPGPIEVNPTRHVAVTAVAEALPYRFTHQGGRHRFAADADFDFSADLLTTMRMAKEGRDYSSPLGRINGFISAAFADVENADVTALNPNAHRADMWQPQQDYVTPLWDFVNSGGTDGRKFDIPRFNSSSGMVGAATEKTEPAGGSYVADLQTITPGQVWGKVELTRQAYRAPSSPQLSGILWDQMLREYFEDREASVAAFLATLTAATDIALTGRPVTTPDNDDDQQTCNDFEAALTRLQYVRGGNQFGAFAVHQDLFEVFARVTDDAGRKLYPMTNPQNANGTAQALFRTINIAGVTAVPSWALGAGGQTTATNSWLFNPAKVRGWASAPERLFWDFGATVQTANIPQLSFVTIGIYGDVAFGNTDIAGVRQVTFDPSV